MYFEQKLNALMHLFKLSNSKLARGINVDPSLVSRWKSGERQMSPASPHVPAIASYFLRLNAYHYQRDFLDQILKQQLGSNDHFNEARRIHALAEWLISSEPLSLPDMADSSEQVARSARLIQSLAGLMAGPLQSVPDAAITPELPNPSRFDRTEDLHGAVRSYEVFEGRSGMRQATLLLMTHILKSDVPLEVLLTSEDDLTWMLENPEYTRQWAQLMRQILHQGHSVTVIHAVNRKQSEILTALAQWTPLHMEGSIRSFYHPAQADRDVRRSLFVVRNHLAVVGYHMPSQGQDDLTFSFSDPQTVAHYTRIFNAWLSNCRPLFSVYSQRSIRQFLEQLREARMQEGTYYSIRQHFSAMILPPDQLMQLLPMTGSQTSKQIQSALSAQVDSFFSSLKNSRTVDILPFSIIDQIRRERALPLTSASFFGQDAFYIRGEQLVLYLQNLIAVLKTEEHYELMFSPGVTDLEKLRVNIALKEGTAAYFSSPMSDQPNPITIVLSENYILQTLGFFFEDFIEQIPEGLSSKPEVIRLLETLLHELRSRPQKQGG